jgi:hypothetical protein
MPIYQTMFSELRHHPRFNFQFKQGKALPPITNTDWPGKQNYQRERLILQKM